MFERFFKPRMKVGMETSYKAGIYFSSGRLALLKLLWETHQHEKGECSVQVVQPLPVIPTSSRHPNALHRHPELVSGSISPRMLWVFCTMDAETSSA
jgi:hypothetical protein